MPAINVILYDVVPPETRASATAADGIILSAFPALTAFAISTVSHTVGVRQGLAEGNPRAGFQGATTALLGGGIPVTLALLRTAPAGMAALLDYAERHPGARLLFVDTFAETPTLEEGDWRELPEKFWPVFDPSHRVRCWCPRSWRDTDFCWKRERG